MPAEHRHPSLNCYKSHGCRCVECRRIAAEHRRNCRLGINYPRTYEHIHPSANCYKSHACRCEGCKAAAAEQNRRRSMVPNVLPQAEVDRLRRLVGYRAEDST